MATTQQMLDHVRTAIDDIVTGGAVQAYMLPGGIQLQRMSLTELRNLEKDLMARLASESTGGSQTYASFRRPS